MGGVEIEQHRFLAGVGGGDFGQEGFFGAGPDDLEGEFEVADDSFVVLDPAWIGGDKAAVIPCFGCCEQSGVGRVLIAFPGGQFGVFLNDVIWHVPANHT